MVDEFVENVNVVVAKPFEGTLTLVAPRVRTGGCAREEFVSDDVKLTVPEKF